jgi:hypothetical protein
VETILEGYDWLEPEEPDATRDALDGFLAREDAP